MSLATGYEGIAILQRLSIGILRELGYFWTVDDVVGVCGAGDARTLSDGEQLDAVVSPNNLKGIDIDKPETITARVIV